MVSVQNYKYQLRKQDKTMALLQQWRDMAYSETANKNELQKLWTQYFQIERNIYEKLLTNPDEEVRGTVKELAEKYDVDIMTMTGFLDGIDESLKLRNPIETMDEDTEVNLVFDKEILYKNMVAAGADWLYGLEQWKSILSADKIKELYREQKNSKTIKKIRSRFIRMIHVRAEAARNIKSAMAEQEFSRPNKICML